MYIYIYVYICAVVMILVYSFAYVGVLQFQFADNTTLAVSRPPADGGWGPTRWVMSW